MGKKLIFIGMEINIVLLSLNVYFNKKTLILIFDGKYEILIIILLFNHNIKDNTKIF